MMSDSSEIELCKNGMGLFKDIAKRMQYDGWVSDKGITYDEIDTLIKTGMDMAPTPGYCDKQGEMVFNMLNTFHAKK